MPRIHLKTNIFLTKEKKLAMMQDMRPVIDSIPWEDSKHLLVDYEDECSMFFAIHPTEACATVEINILQNVYDKVGQDIMEVALYQLTDIVSRHCKIPFDRIFAFYRGVPVWAWEGLNVEKTIIHLDQPAPNSNQERFKANSKHLSCKFL